MNTEFDTLRASEDLDLLRKELMNTENSSPESMMHAVYIASKTNLLKKRIKELEKSLHEVFG